MSEPSARAPVEAVVTADADPALSGRVARPRIRATAVEVDRAALCDNARQIASLTGTPVVAVVKADGYGHGAVAVARVLEAAGACAGFAVSLVEEGAEGPEGLVVRRRPTQQELANMIGSCRETISRAFNQLARDGLIIARGRALVVTPALIERSERKKAA